MNGSSSIRAGRYTVDILDLDRFRLDGGAMFGIIPKPLWERACPPDQQNRIAMGCQSLLLRSESHTVLVDAGMGDKWSQREREIYAVETPDEPAGRRPDTRLIRALAEVGIRPDDITDVVLTHLHFDHAGGLTRRTPAGGLEPTLPGARHWVQTKHLDWARGPSEKDRGSFPGENIDPLAADDLFCLVDGEQELLPGIVALPLYGHTVAMQALLIGDDEPLFFPADLLPLAPHLHLPYIMAYDIEPLTTLNEKKRYLELAHREQWRLVLEHEPRSQIGRVNRFRGKYVWGTDPQSGSKVT